MQKKPIFSVSCRNNTTMCRKTAFSGVRAEILLARDKVSQVSQEAKIDDSGSEVHEEDDGEVKQALLAPWTSWNSV